MPLAIQGIRLRSLTVSNEEGVDKISAQYELIAPTGAVMAKQSLSSKESYGETIFAPSFETAKLLKEAVAAYKRDVEQMLGFE